uniref:Uncharacterized protein n=1 Tax=Tanacetum cinerariifolium TaxID=118510 RepID=A0A6L2N1L6_TANCI|nr:hypothetical protein [Tanacetum cinerariifolium]
MDNTSLGEFDLARDSELNSFNSGKEKQHGLVNDTINDTVVMTSVVDELDSGNTLGKHEGNVGKTPSSSIVDPNIGNTNAPNKSYVPISVHESPTSDNFAPIRSGPTSYAKLVTGEPSATMSREELERAKLYIPKILKENYILVHLKPIIRDSENRSIHEGRTMHPEFAQYSNLKSKFSDIRL